MFPQATRLNAAGWAHLLAFGLWLPAAVVWSAHKVAARTKRMRPRLAHFQSASMELLVLAVASVVVARVQHLELFPSGVPHLSRGIIAGAVMYVATVLFMRP